MRETQPALARLEDGGSGYEPQDVAGSRTGMNEKVCSPLELLEKTTALRFLISVL